MVFFYDAETYRGLTSPAPSSLIYPAQWHSFVKNTKVLYFRQQYKRCINESEMMLQEEAGRLLPLHETFLHFYIAICNESLGLAAHKFSSKKLTFLHAAKDAFVAALLSLPLSYLSENSGDHDGDRVSPLSLDVDRFANDHDKENDIAYSSELNLFRKPQSSSDAQQSLHERSDSGYDSETETSPIYNDKVPDFKHYSARQPLTTLISPNEVQPKPKLQKSNPKPSNLKDNDLIPKPLSIKKRATIDSFNTSSPLQQQSLIAINNHNHPHDSTPRQKFNTSLTNFQSHLSVHLTTINHTITTATNLQTQHRLNQSKRLASFWSFEPVLRGKVSSAIKPNPPRPNCSTRPSLPHESNNSGANRNKVNRTQSEKSGDKDAEKRERIERLRSQGWQVTKEKHGYKGGEYYERLRREAGEEVLARVGVGGQGKQLHRICLGG